MREIKFDSVSDDVNDILKKNVELLMEQMNYNSMTKAERKKIDSRIHKAWELWKQEVLDKAVKDDAEQ